MTAEHVEEISDWLSKEAEQLTKDIRKYNEAYDYYSAAKMEGMRDAYLRCIKKLYLLKAESEMI